MLIENLRKNFKSGITKSKECRLAQLKNLMKMYEEGESELIAALKEDLGKPTAEAMMYEVDFNKNFVKHTIAALGIDYSVHLNWRPTNLCIPSPILKIQDSILYKK